jgi:hypothetical protein
VGRQLEVRMRGAARTRSLDEAKANYDKALSGDGPWKECQSSTMRGGRQWTICQCQRDLEGILPGMWDDRRMQELHHIPHEKQLVIRRSNISIEFHKVLMIFKGTHSLSLLKSRECSFAHGLWHAPSFCVKVCPAVSLEGFSPRKAISRPSGASRGSLSRSEGASEPRLGLPLE